MATRINDLEVKAMFEQLNQLPDELVKDAYQVFRKNTPVDKGNARRNTILRRTTIEADYNYAQPLDEGHSKQSPQGMTKPTIEFLESELEKKVRGIK